MRDELEHERQNKFTTKAIKALRVQLKGKVGSDLVDLLGEKCDLGLFSQCIIAQKVQTSSTLSNLPIWSIGFPTQSNDDKHKVERKQFLKCANEQKCSSPLLEFLKARKSDTDLEKYAQVSRLIEKQSRNRTDSLVKTALSFSKKHKNAMNHI